MWVGFLGFKIFLGSLGVMFVFLICECCWFKIWILVGSSYCLKKSVICWMRDGLKVDYKEK